jgi:membrane fusion protein (multidrug efflux system)
MKKIKFLPLLGWACLWLAGCGPTPGATTNSDTFPVTSPLVMDTAIVQEYVAEINAVQNVEIRARVKGFIEKIHVDEGEAVQAGQLLFSMSQQEFRQELLKATAQLKSAQAEAKIAEVEVQNTKVLVDKNIVARTEYEMAQAKLEAAQARIEEAQSAVSSAELNLGFTAIRAPFSGIINRQPLKMGSLVDEGTLLTTISDNSEVFAYFHVSEKEYLSILKEKAADHLADVDLVLADGHVFPQEGKIETVESEIDRSTGNLAFRARFANPERLLKHGASGKIQLLTRLPGAMIIPQKATFDIQEKTFLYVLDQNNVVQNRQIEVEYRLQHLYVVKDGLSARDRIIYEGIQQLKVGDKVVPDPKTMRGIMEQLALR